MEFKVLSRSKAKKYSFGSHSGKSIIVSITDIGSENIKFNKNESNGIISIIPIKCDDVDGNEFGAMTINDTEKIVNFVNRYKDSVDTIIVNCEAGICRSSGTCAAIMKYITGDDMEIFNNGQFTPNMHCYRNVLNAFHVKEDEKEISEKENINLNAWKKKNDLD